MLLKLTKFPSKKPAFNLTIKTRQITFASDHISSEKSPKLKLKAPKKLRVLSHNSNTEIAVFLDLLSELKDFLKHKQYSKVYESVFSWILKENRGFHLGLEIKLMRVFFTTISKRIRNSLVKKVADFTKLQNLISQNISVLKNWYKFLTTSLSNINTAKNPSIQSILDKNSNEYPTLENSTNSAENEDLPGFLEVIQGKFGNLNEFPNKINEIFESTFFIRKTLEFLIYIGFYFQRTKKDLYLAYKYFKKAHKTAIILEITINPDLLNLCAKAHLILAVFLLDFRVYKKAKKLLLSTMTLLQAEIFYRMREKLSNCMKLKLKRTIKTLLTVMLNLVFCYEQFKEIEKIAEIFKIIEFFNTFLSQKDEFHKTIHKILKEFHKKFREFLHEIAEISEITENFLKNDQVFQDKLKENDEKNPGFSHICPKTSRFLKKNRAFKLKKQGNNPKARLSLDLKSLKNHEKDEKTICNFESASKRTCSTYKPLEKPNFSIEQEEFLINQKNLLIDFLDNSFVKSTENSLFEGEENGLKETVLFQKELAEKLKKKGKKLINGHFKTFREDYKPKILTSDEYFVKKEKTKENKGITEEKDGVLLENLQIYPRKPGFRKKKAEKNNDFQKDYFTERLERTISESIKAESRYKITNKSFFFIFLKFSFKNP